MTLGRPILFEIIEHDDHFHNREYWFGIAAAPDATHWADRTRLTPFVVTSGNGDFGTDPGDEALVIGTADTPVRAGSKAFDMRRFSIVDVSTAQLMYLRVIWGTPTQTMAQAEAAGQYTEIAVQQQTAAGQNKPQDLVNERRPVGNQVWVRSKCSVNNATCQFVVGIHEYPAP